jgi:hypothetical protein
MKKNKPKILGFDDAVATVKEGRKLREALEESETETEEKIRQYCLAVFQDLLNAMNKTFDILEKYPELVYNKDTVFSISRPKYTVGYHPAEFCYIPSSNQLYPVLITSLRKDGCVLDIPDGLGYNIHDVWPTTETKIRGFSVSSVSGIIDRVKHADKAVGNWAFYKQLVKTIAPIPKLIQDAVVYSAQRFKRLQDAAAKERKELIEEEYVPVI